MGFLVVLKTLVRVTKQNSEEHEKRHDTPFLL